MIDNVLVPVIKSKTGRRPIMSKDSYRPIALASVVSKVAESIILIVSLVIWILVRINSDSKGITAQINAYNVLKEIIDAYRVMNGSVFCVFLDASKAFDRFCFCLLLHPSTCEAYCR